MRRSLSSLVAGIVLLCAAAVAAAHEVFEPDASGAEVLGRVLAVAKRGEAATITAPDVRAVAAAFDGVPRELVTSAPHWKGVSDADLRCKRRYHRLLAANDFMVALRGIGDDDAQLAVLLSGDAESDLVTAYVQCRSRAPEPQLVRLATQWTESDEPVRRYLAGRLAQDALEFGGSDAALCRSIVQRAIDDRDPVVASTFIRSVGPAIRDVGLIRHLANRMTDIRKRPAVGAGIFRGASGTVGDDALRALASMRSEESPSSADAAEAARTKLAEWAKSLPPAGRAVPEPGRWVLVADQDLRLKPGEERTLPTTAGTDARATLESYAERWDAGVPTYRAVLTVRIGTGKDEVAVRLSANDAPQGFDPEARSPDAPDRHGGSLVRAAIAGDGAAGARVRLWIWQAAAQR